jgi:hypothetical protein
MTLRYICCRCDARAEVSVGHHLCRAPSNAEINQAVAQASGSAVAWLRVSDSIETAIDVLGSHALSRGYCFTLTQLGADEYRVSFFHNIDTLASTALDRTPARAFARAFIRIPEE